jgi:hypothetical protein
VSAIDSVRFAVRVWLLGRPDETILRWLYRGVLVATVTVVALDYGDLSLQTTENASAARTLPGTAPLPQIKRERGARLGAPSRQMEAKLRETMTFDLVGDGRLMATGTISYGTAKAFAAEIEKRGAYVKTVVLQSPGGSVQDALDMGRLVRAKKFSTEVERGHYCVSSCPLVFAGGVTRRAGAKAAIGVHQVFAPAQPGLSTPADGMDSAQRIAATAESYLRDMGVDLAVWVRAMETPHDELYYFTPKEMIELKLATDAAGGAIAKDRGKAKS